MRPNKVNAGIVCQKISRAWNVLYGLINVHGGVVDELSDEKFWRGNLNLPPPDLGRARKCLEGEEAVRSVTARGQCIVDLTTRKGVSM